MCVCAQVVCERECATMLCGCVTKLCVTKLCVCDKVVCERWCVTKVCVCVTKLCVCVAKLCVKESLCDNVV